jgi:hypothetical protein
LQAIQGDLTARDYDEEKLKRIFHPVFREFIWDTAATNITAPIPCSAVGITGTGIRLDS